jgi:hypothetical protein
MMTTMRKRRATASRLGLALLAALSCGAALALEPLSDQQLDAITAGAEESKLEEIVVHAARLTSSGKQVVVDGTVGVQRPTTEINAADLLLRDSAQSNLQSLINLNAAHSVVNVLVNLNINIDSHVGELRQLNLASPAGN